MKMFKNSIAVITLLFATTILSQKAEAGTSIDKPTLIECNTCYTDYQFKQKALSVSVPNQVSYFVIYNKQAEIMKTIKTVYVFEPNDEYLNIKKAYLLTSSKEHLEYQESFLGWILGGNVYEANVEIDMNYDPSAPWDTFSYVNQELMSDYGIFYKVRVAYGAVITVTTNSGHTLVMVKQGAVEATSEQYEVLLVLDGNGNVVQVNATGVELSSGTYFFRVSGFGGYTLRIRTGTVTITREDE